MRPPQHQVASEILQGCRSDWVHTREVRLRIRRNAYAKRVYGLTLAELDARVEREFDELLSEITARNRVR